MHKYNLCAYTYENYFLKPCATQRFCKIRSLIPSFCPSAYPSACPITVFDRNDWFVYFLLFPKLLKTDGAQFSKKILVGLISGKKRVKPTLKLYFDTIFENLYYYNFLTLIINERPYYCWYFRAGHISGKIESIKLSASLKCDILWTKFCISWFFCKQIKIPHTAQKMKFFIKDFFSKWDQIRRKLQI